MPSTPQGKARPELRETPGWLVFRDPTLSEEEKVEKLQALIESEPDYHLDTRGYLRSLKLARTAKDPSLDTD